MFVQFTLFTVSGSRGCVYKQNQKLIDLLSDMSVEEEKTERGERFHKVQLCLHLPHLQEPYFFP